MKLTDTFVKRKQGNGKVQKHSDGGGLFLYITPEGKKSWRLGYRFLGKQKLLVIGPYPAISLKEARERREAAKKMLVDNIDPSTAKQEAKTAAANALQNAFEKVALEWLEKNATLMSGVTKASIERRLCANIFPFLGKRPVHSITAPELLAVLRKIESRGALSVAHKARSDCGRIFRYAIATGRAERDVAADLQGALSPEPPAIHFASIIAPKRIGKLLLDLDIYPGSFQVRYALKLAPFVFVRSHELAEAEWAEFDFTAREWRIPAHKMKMKQMHIVPLSRQALSILAELKDFSRNYPERDHYLFPGRTKSKEYLHPDNFVTALRRMGYSNNEMTFHGFRSMASTILNEKGYNRDWIERQLAHSERNGARAAYNYAEYLPERRKMMQDWADYLTELKEKAKKETASSSIAPACVAGSGGKRQG
jgi:integrase